MGKANILVVDDEEDLLELVQFHLTREGYQVQRASTGEEALKKVKRDQFNLIVLDLMLPGIDGIEVA
ncbi:MAG: response regulator, partial [Geobacteraceae bacterium]